MNVATVPTEHATPKQRLDQLATFVSQRFDAGTASRPALIREARDECERSNLDVPLSLMVAVCALFCDEGRGVV